MEPTDITIEILKQIRDEIRQTNSRVDTTNSRLDETNSRLDEKFDKLNSRLAESEIRTATAINALAGTLGDIKQLLSDRLELNDRVGQCEQDIARLNERVGIAS